MTKKNSLRHPLPKEKSIAVNNQKTGTKWPPLRLAILLGIIAFCLYANTLNNDYALDDLATIQKNALVRKGISAIPEILSTPYHYGNFRIAPNGKAIDDLYRPLSLVMFAVEFQLFGENPMPGHLVNIILYAACVMLLFLFLHRLFREKKPALAFICTLLFTLHPIHTEVVANIKSRDELLCFFFGFLSLLAFIKYHSADNVRYLAGGLVFYFLSLLSKETSITFIAVIPLIFFFSIAENRKKSIIISLLSVGLVCLYLAIRFSILLSHQSYNPANIPFIENALIGAPSFGSRIATAILVLGYYVKLLILPYPLICDYSFNAIPYTGFNNIGVWLSLIVYVSIAVLGVVRLIRKREDALAFGILFFLVTISVFTNILFLLASEMAERFLFFPSVGYCLVAAFVIEQFLVKRGTSDTREIWASPKAIAVLAALSLIFTAYLL